MKRFVLVAWIASSIAFSAQGQDSTPTYKEWINAGIGFWTPFAKTEGLEFSYVLSYNFGWDGLYYQVGIHGISRPLFFGPDYGVGSTSFLLGARNTSRWWQAAVFSGPALTGITRSGSSSVATTVGLVVNLQGTLRLADDFGIGVDVYGNANAIQSVAALRFVLYISNAK